MGREGGGEGVTGTGSYVGMFFFFIVLLKVVDSVLLGNDRVFVRVFVVAVALARKAVCAHSLQKQGKASLSQLPPA